MTLPKPDPRCRIGRIGRVTFHKVKSSRRLSEILGMSGECLCGAHAHAGEKAMVRLVDPATADYLDELEKEVRAAGHNWGWEDRPPKAPPAQPKDDKPDMFFCRGCEKRGASPQPEQISILDAAE